VDRAVKLTVVGVILSAISVGIALVSLDSFPGLPEIPDVLVLNGVLISEKYGYTFTAPDSPDWTIFTDDKDLDKFETAFIPWNINTRGKLTSMIINDSPISENPDNFVISTIGVFVNDNDSLTFNEYISDLETDISNVHPTIRFTTGEAVGINQHQLVYFLTKCDTAPTTGCGGILGFDIILTNDGKIYTISQLISDKRSGTQMLSAVIDPNTPDLVDIAISEKIKEIEPVLRSFQFL